MKTYAFYLPQYYPIPENDKYWGKGFTEWRNVASAKPLFKGHNQPRIPTDLGFYDLRNVDAMRTQIESAKSMGINGFSFWHYWFGNGKRALEKPAEAFLKNKDLDFEIYFTWANYRWSKSWVGKDEEVIFDQTYSEDDYIQHFDYLLPFFKDSRYSKINNKPLFSMLKPGLIPDQHFFDLFDQMAIKNGFDGITWLTPWSTTPTELQNRMDFLYGFPPGDFWNFEERKHRYLRKAGINNGPKKYDYGRFHTKVIANAIRCYENFGDKYIATFLPNWDNTPRYNSKGYLFVNNSVGKMKDLLNELYSMSTKNKSKIFLIKAWNEWAEGNYLEPDELNGNAVGEMVGSILKG